MNIEPIGILAKLDLTQGDVAAWINKRRQTVIEKIKNDLFNQVEQIAIINQLRHLYHAIICSEKYMMDND